MLLEMFIFSQMLMRKHSIERHSNELVRQVVVWKEHCLRTCEEDRGSTLEERVGE